MTTSADPAAIVDRILEATADTGITRRSDDRWVAGICSGIAARFAIDPVVVRVATITLSLLTGLGLVAYGAAYLLLPAPDGPSPLARARGKGVKPVMLILLLGVLAIGGVAAAFSGGNNLGSWSSFPVIPVFIGLALVYYFGGNLGGARGGLGHGTCSGKRRRRRPGSTNAAPPPPPGGSTNAASPPPPAGGSANPGATGTTPTPQDRPARTPAQAVTAEWATAEWATTPEVVGPPVLIPVPSPPGSTPAAGGPVAFPLQTSPTEQTATGPTPNNPSGVPGAQVGEPPPAGRPRHRRLGVVGTLAGLGGALAAYGLAVSIHHASGASGSATPVGLAAALAALALVLVVAGSMGRRGGLVAAAAVPLAIVCAANAASGSDVWADGAGERTWAPTSVAPADYRLGAGDAVLDLATYPQHSSGQTPRITATVGFGQLTIQIPDDLTVRVDSSIRWGNLSENDTIGKRRADTGGDHLHLSRTYGSGEPDVVVAANVTGGEVAVVRK